MIENEYHIPALLKPTLDIMHIRPDGIYIDATLGGGGHTRGILERLGPEGRLFVFDRDTDALENAPADPRVVAVHSDFRYIPNFMRYHGVQGADGILADLGVSFHHFDDASRGFSFRADAPLDMRMNRRAPLTAADILASIQHGELTAMLRQYTDLARPDRVASAIVTARDAKPLLTTSQLAEAAQPALNPARVKKELAQVFQALRISVNDEMGGLRALLNNTARVLRQDGVLAILTYHSVEDRLVKRFFRSGSLDGKTETDLFGHSFSPWQPLTRNGITADAEEVAANPRARSARLRAARYIGYEEKSSARKTSKYSQK